MTRVGFTVAFVALALASGERRGAGRLAKALTSLGEFDAASAIAERAARRLELYRRRNRKRH